MRWLNYQHFFYFWRVAKKGSITEASKELRLAQPTISVQLRQFEEMLGQPLFERQGRQLKLTEFGELAFRYAERVFTSGNEFLDAVEGKDPELIHELRIGLSDVIPKAVAYRIIEPALHPSSHTLLRCSEDKTEKLLAELAIGELDLVISDCPIPPNVKVKAFNHPLGSSAVVLMASPKLAKKFRRGFPRSLEDAPLLLPTPEAAVRRELDQWFYELGFTPRCIGEFQDRALMKLIAREGHGIIPLPAVVASRVAREFGLQAIGEAGSAREHFYLISVEKRLKNPLVKALVEKSHNLFSQSS